LDVNDKYLKSIREILPEDCYETGGSRPVKVFCNDWNEYICKYFTGKGFASGLFNEYLAVSFLKLWNLRVPDFAFVQVQRDHLNQVKFPYHYFKIPCYGSLFNPGFKEMDKFFIGFAFHNEHLEKLVHQYLKIGLFDIWLSNEDRNWGNMNFMFDVESVNFIPIDHVQIFNGNNLDKEPAQITEDESILRSPLMSKNFLRTLQQSSDTLRTTFTIEFNKDLSLCHENLDKILQNVPPEWSIDPLFIKSRLNHYFSKEWQEKSLSTFFTYIQYALNRKP
jgi:hypothetical protein